jgi:RNA polymerase sigma-70 factor (ECF subfamily)
VVRTAPKIVDTEVNPCEPDGVLRVVARLDPRRTRRSDLDEHSIRLFLATDYPKVVSGMALICGSRAVAEDAVQEALARAWERSERGERIDSLKAWVTTVAMNQMRSGFRRLRAERRARQRSGAGGPGNAPSLPSVSGAEQAADIRRALMALPRRQREATVLRYYLDLDVAEVAHALRVSEGTAKTTLHRARKALAAALGEGELEEANDVAGI